ncbi:MAG: LysM peptidoglycan-binding domain-containing protein [Deferribacteraceae bacterium]|jgi:hypothetical protein|nr:LysM peptidoglycan-binding domain-containing protein [Deferribacteraceae bacterium]
MKPKLILFIFLFVTQFVWAYDYNTQDVFSITDDGHLIIPDDVIYGLLVWGWSPDGKVAFSIGNRFGIFDAVTNETLLEIVLNVNKFTCSSHTDCKDKMKSVYSEHELGIINALKLYDIRNNESRPIRLAKYDDGNYTNILPYEFNINDTIYKPILKIKKSVSEGQIEGYDIYLNHSKYGQKHVGSVDLSKSADDMWSSVSKTEIFIQNYYKSPFENRILFEVHTERINNWAVGDTYLHGAHLDADFNDIIEYETYTVVRGDSLWKIAEKVYADPSMWLQLYRSNRSVIKDPDNIYPNQQLKISR